MGSMTENIADKAINDTRIVKQFTNPVKEPIDSDINLFDLLDNRAKRDPEGAMIEYKGDDGTWHPYSAQVFRDMVVVPEFLRTLVFARPRGDDQFADCTFSPSLDMSR